MSDDDIPNSPPGPSESASGQAAWTFRGNQMQAA